MQPNDFRHMWRGKQIKALSKEDVAYLKPYHHKSKVNDHALLLLHGYSSSPAVYRKMLPKLLERYGVVVCPALAGHAENIDAFATVKAHDWIQTAEKAYQELAHQYPKVDVLGLSLGGLLASHLASRFSINHLYLLAPALSLKTNIPLALNLAKFLKAIGFKALRNRAGNLKTTESTEIAYRQLPIETIIEVLKLVAEFEWTPPQCPTDVFLGQFDQVVDSRGIEAYFVGLSHAKIHWLNNSAHVLPLDGDIEHILACIGNRS